MNFNFDDLFGWLEKSKTHLVEGEIGLEKGGN